MHEVVSQPFYKIGSEEGENAIMQRNVKKIYRINDPCTESISFHYAKGLGISLKFQLGLVNFFMPLIYSLKKLVLIKISKLRKILIFYTWDSIMIILLLLYQWLDFGTILCKFP